MRITFQLAQASDAGALCQLMQVVWPGMECDADYIAGLLGGDDGHTAWLAQNDGRIVGFADGFLTVNEAGQARWELDLLGVHPDFRGEGIATELVRRCTRSGFEKGAALFRGLIAVGNSGSEKTFSRCGYHPAGESALFIHSDPVSGDSDAECTCHQVYVNTLSYRGIWLEGAVTPGCLLSAAAEKNRKALDVAGVVIASEQVELAVAASGCGYIQVGQYRFWNLSRDAVPEPSSDHHLYG